MSSSSSLLALCLAPLAAQTLSTHEAAKNTGVFHVSPSHLRHLPSASCSLGFVGPRLTLPHSRRVEVHVGGNDFNRLPRPPQPGRIARKVQAMDVDGPEVSGAGKQAAVVRRDVPWQGETRATVELPDVEVPLDLPQPGEWLQVPLKEPRLQRELKASSGAKLDPFAVPDNEYHDSWLDSLWINILSGRMSAAVEAEAHIAPARGGRRGGLGDASTGVARGRDGSAVGAAGDGGESMLTAAAVAVAGELDDDGEAAGTMGWRDDDGAIGMAVAAATAAGGGGAGARIGSVAASFLMGAGEAITGASVGPKETARDGGGGGGAGAGVATSKGSGMSVQSRKGGGYTYEDYVALATRLQAGPPERQRQVVRGVLRSVFPAWFLPFYRTIFPPSKFSAQVNAFMCPPLFGWLVGKSELIDGVVDLKGVGGAGPSQEVWRSTVKVERCRYLEASKCKGTCMNLCKLPTEAFFREDLGLPMRMTPNFEDLSCEFAFGQAALPAEDDPLMQEPCWTECLSSGLQPKRPQRACHTMPESPLKS